MTDSPDDNRGADPRERVGDRRARTWRTARLRDLSPATLTSLAVGLIVIVVIGALTAFSTPRRSELPPPIAEEAIHLDSSGAPEPELPPTISFSPAPVSLSTRASMPSPSHRPTATSRPTRSEPSPSSPKPQPTQPRPGELTPLPPSQEPSLRSADGGQETFLDFVNTRPEPVTVYWLDYGGQRQQYAVLQPGQSYRQQTYVGHPWVVTNGEGLGLVCFLPAYETLRAVVR